MRELNLSSVKLGSVDEEEWDDGPFGLDTRLLGLAGDRPRVPSQCHTPCREPRCIGRLVAIGWTSASDGHQYKQGSVSQGCPPCRQDIMDSS
jgi:hypothetical protein